MVTTLSFDLLASLARAIAGGLLTEAFLLSFDDGHAIMHTFVLGTGPLSFSWATQRPVPAPAHFVFAVAQYGRHAPYRQMSPALQSLVPPHDFPIVVEPAAMHDAVPAPRW